ncbi:MAG: hypothetical protein LBI36_01910, partial [Oscillospiraceae bacterium]|nr:hypothetical protein [Oscillospiraceae bacterium]
RFSAKILPNCVNPPRKAQSLASSGFLARQNFLSKLTRKRFSEVPNIYVAHATKVGTTRRKNDLE